jgi:hypothetical protein
MRRLLLGRREYLYLSLTLVLVALLVLWAVLHPAIYHEWCVRYYIPSVQEQFGFKAERISLVDAPYRPLTLVQITPGGLLDRAGFRAGDIPVDHHGGETAFCGALQYATEGGEPSVSVINAGEWSRGYAARRTLTLSRSGH